MKRNDYLLIILFFILAIALWFWINRAPALVTNGEVAIFKDGQEYAIVPLSIDKTITVEGENGNRNVIRIKDGRAEMIGASCPDQICVHTRAVQKDGQSIVCLPNRVTVEVRSGEKNEVDGVSE